MERRAFLKRFFEIAGIGPDHPFLYLSSDCTMGVFKKFQKKNFVPLGSYKLTKPLTKLFYWGNDSLEIYDGHGIGVLRFRKAMYILKRRKYFDLGVYRLSEKKFDWAFIVGNGENMIILAPRIIRFKSFSIPLDSVVEKIDEKLKTWRVLTKL